jgi:hypothetical protein
MTWFQASLHRIPVVWNTLCSYTVKLTNSAFSFRFFSTYYSLVNCFVSFRVNSFKSSTKGIMSIILEAVVLDYKEYRTIIRDFMQRNLVEV